MLARSWSIQASESVAARFDRTKFEAVLIVEVLIFLHNCGLEEKEHRKDGALVIYQYSVTIAYGS